MINYLVATQQMRHKSHTELPVVPVDMKNISVEIKAFLRDRKQMEN